MGRRDVGGVEVFPSAGALAQAAAEHTVRAAAAAMRQSGRFVVALSGGSTPRSLYALLASEPYARRVDWSRVHVCWSDERCVSPADPASNYRLAREALLEHVPLPEGNIHRILGEDEPDAAAAAYERELRSLLGTPGGKPEPTPGARFDLVLLGMGADGHTASLFPGSTAARESERWVAAEQVAATPAWRVTLTPVVINAAAEVTFLVSGREKAAMLRRVLEDPCCPDELPAQAVAPSDGQLRWLVDAAAAADIRRSG